MEKLISYFFFDYRLKIQSTWFKQLLYLYLILRVFQCFYQFDLLFGEHSLVYSSPQSIGLFKDLAFLLYAHFSPVLSLLVLLVILSLSAIRLFTSKLPFIADLLLWILMLNVHYAIYPSLTGGDLLLNQFLFFNCLISNSFDKKETWRSEVRVCLHNVAVIAIMVQLCVVYFLSGLAKVGDPDWQSGKAILLVAQIDHFSSYSLLRYHASFGSFYRGLTYLVLFYQLLFPVLVWIKSIKKSLLLIGVLMHLYIGFVMGLPEFSAIMIIAYVYFWPVKPRFS